MPADHSVDPTWLDVVATQLTRSRTAALEASHELLAHYSDTGDAPTQRSVDTLINHAVGALGALTDNLEGAAGTLQEAAHESTSSHVTPLRQGRADGSSSRTVRGHDHGA